MGYKIENSHGCAFRSAWAPLESVGRGEACGRSALEVGLSENNPHVACQRIAPPHTQRPEWDCSVELCSVRVWVHAMLLGVEVSSSSQTVV